MKLLAGLVVVVLAVSAAPAAGAAGVPRDGEPPATIVVGMGKGPTLGTTQFWIENGRPYPMTSYSSSGAPVVFTTVGECAVVGNILTAGAGNGICTLTAGTASGGGFSAATASYDIIMTPGAQSVPNAAPRSGRISPGTKVLLGRRGTSLVSSAGQPVTWKVTKGRRLCTIVMRAHRIVLVAGTRTGTCVVVASAPAVPDQWTAMAFSRTYRIKAVRQTNEDTNVGNSKARR